MFSSIPNHSSIVGSPRPFDASTFSIASNSTSSTSSTSDPETSSASSFSQGPSIVVKVHTPVLCQSVAYKTISITPQTTAREVVKTLLAKFRMKNRDNNLYYITMEIWIRKTGIPIRSVMVLDDLACPAYLQSSYPHQQTKFTLCMRRGGLVKVYDNCLMTGSHYKSILLSDRTTVAELIMLLLYCYNSPERPQKFAIYEVCPARKYERRLQDSELPLRLQLEWPAQDPLVFFQLRKTIADEPLPLRLRVSRPMPWTTTFDRTGNVAFRLNLKHENSVVRHSLSSVSSSLSSPGSSLHATSAVANLMMPSSSSLLSTASNSTVSSSTYADLENYVYI